MVSLHKIFCCLRKSWKLAPARSSNSAKHKDKGAEWELKNGERKKKIHPSLWNIRFLPGFQEFSLQEHFPNLPSKILSFNRCCCSRNGGERKFGMIIKFPTQEFLFQHPGSPKQGPVNGKSWILHPKCPHGDDFG